ncbi:MAG: CCA tRNA nucleotidyltransferase [Caulobacteraceae bacterium]
MAALAAAGGPDCARFVGGCVRNAVLGSKIEDIDIATTLEPHAVVAALAAAKIKAVPTGLAHGTITAVVAGRPFEVTTLRRDVETDGRHAKVAFTDDWMTDALRRDFRLNALYADEEGRLYDPTGEGLADAKAGRVVFVGDAATRIAEDALRILRFFRFVAWYGRGEIDAAGLEACQEKAEMIAGLSAERIAKELLVLLSAEDPRPAVRLMAASGVLARALPEAARISRFEALVEVEIGILFETDPLLRLAALLADEANAQRASSRLKLSNAQAERLTAALGEEPGLVSWMSPKEMRRLVWKVGVATFCDRVMLAWAASDRPAAAVQWRALLPMARSWPRPSLPVDGRQVEAAGVPKGPQIGEVLSEIEAWWIDQDFPADPLAAVERLKAVVQGMVQ